MEDERLRKRVILGGSATILKREYPGVVEDRDENGALIRKRAALD